MRAIAIILALVCAAAAITYFLVPADSLPAFLPGHEAGLARIRTKHGIVAAVAAVVLFAFAWWRGR
jgi:hypothetical protein